MLRLTNQGPPIMGTTGTNSDTLGKELREAARTIELAAHETRCWSVIHQAVTALVDHITAMAGNVEKNALIADLEAKLETERIRTRIAVGQENRENREKR